MCNVKMVIRGDYENISKYLETSYDNFGLIFLSQRIILTGERGSFLCAIKTRLPGVKTAIFVITVPECAFDTRVQLKIPIIRLRRAK